MAVPILIDWPCEDEVEGEVAVEAELDDCVGELVEALAAGDAEPAEVGTAHSRGQQSAQPACLGPS